MSESNLLQEIVDRFQIKNGSKAIVRRQLRKLLKSAHPDSTGGTFEDESQQKRHQEISDAIEALDQSAGQQLVPNDVRAVVGLLERQNLLLSKQHEEASRQMERDRSSERLRNLEASATASLRGEIARRYLPRKLSAAAIGAFGVFITASGSSFSSLLALYGMNPEQSSAAATVLSGLFVLAGATIALAAFLAEERAKNQRQRILSEPLFEDFIRSPEFAECLSYGDEDSNYRNNRVSIVSIGRAVENFGRLDSATSEEVAEVMAERLLNRELATKVAGPNLSPVLRLEDKLADELAIEKYRRANTALKL